MWRFKQLLWRKRCQSPIFRNLLGLLINFQVALIKDGITRIVNGLEEDNHAKPQKTREQHLLSV